MLVARPRQSFALKDSQPIRSGGCDHAARVAPAPGIPLRKNFDVLSASACLQSPPSADAQDAAITRPGAPTLVQRNLRRSFFYVYGPSQTTESAAVHRASAPVIVCAIEKARNRPRLAPAAPGQPV